MTAVDKDYENLLLESWRDGDEQIKRIIYTEKQMSKESKRYHKMEDHDYMMKKFKHCPHCMGGSIPETPEEHKERKRREER